MTPLILGIVSISLPRDTVDFPSLTSFRKTIKRVRVNFYVVFYVFKGQL